MDDGKRKLKRLKWAQMNSKLWLDFSYEKASHLSDSYYQVYARESVRVDKAFNVYTEYLKSIKQSKRWTEAILLFAILRRRSITE